MTVPGPGQIALPNGQVINVSREFERVRALAQHALAMQTIVIEHGPSGILQWVRWQMTDAVLARFAEFADRLFVAGLRVLDIGPDGSPLLFGLPVVLVEQPDGEPPAWGLYLAIAA